MDGAFDRSLERCRPSFFSRKKNQHEEKTLSCVLQTNSDGLALSSCVLALLLNDYRNRLEMRSRSALMFRNSTCALFEMYVVFLEFDPFVAKCLVKPMFQSLDILLDEHAVSEDLEIAGTILTNHGAALNNLNSYLVDRLIVKIRSKICSDDQQMNGDIRRIFLHVLDLWVWGWNELMIPECLTIGYFDKVPSVENSTPERKCGIGNKEFGNRESVV
uniref:CID domain-containing protein n=1 Tax=Angiostrongylus cantonensis TaxID=6313 RepID=A0A0K0DRI4_ANGCA